jgi:hypothetical protein
MFGHSSYFKILVEICKIISHGSILFSDKMNQNKLYDIYFLKMNKTNGQMQLKKSMRTII